jgi:hypothetical protein
MSPNRPVFSVFVFFSILLPASTGLPNPDPATILPFHPTQSSPGTIPAFPEQSNVAGCPLDLPDELFHGIKAACGAAKDGAAKDGADGQLHRSRCCPVLATWLYAAYSATALGRASRVGAAAAGHSSATTTSYDLPLLPDDSETCVDDLGKALKEKGIQVARPNETCDVMYCYCGIRLHPLSCPEAFSVTQMGKLVGDDSVKRLERDCLSSSSNVNAFPGLGGCSRCLNSLYMVSFLL